jgi:hypothetical protein
MAVVLYGRETSLILKNIFGFVNTKQAWKLVDGNGVELTSRSSEYVTTSFVNCTNHLVSFSFLYVLL